MARLSAWKMAGAVLLLCAATAIAAQAQTFAVLFDFDGINGQDPGFPGVFAQGRDGNLYGTASLGGTSNMGVAFKLTPTGTFTLLYNFDGTHGLQPHGGLTLGTDGSLYGATGGGGSAGGGTVFAITPSGDLTTLYDFSVDPGGLEASPILGGDDNFYGTSVNGGGNAYKITGSGAFTLLTQLPYFPYAPLFYGSDGNLYGTTFTGGSQGSCFEGCGTVFRMTPNGTVTTLYDFDGPHGEEPYGGVIQGSDNNLYGTTSAGGSRNGGTVFRLSPQGITVLKNLGGLDGSDPAVGLIQASDGNLYGVAQVGGRLNRGVIFRVTPVGYSVVHDFDGANGQVPETQLIQHTNGKLYGMTEGGGVSGDGVIYDLDLGLQPFVRLVSTSGKVNSTGGILGQGFTGTTGVSLNGTPASFTVVSDTFIEATVPAGATTGYVTVTTPSGTLTSNVPFHVLP